MSICTDHRTSIFMESALQFIWKKTDPWKRHDLGLVWELLAPGYGLLASKICLKGICKDPIRLITYIVLGMKINILRG